MKVLDAGHRERQALLKLHDKLHPVPRVPGYVTYATWLEKVDYDAYHDAFVLLDGTIITVENCINGEVPI